MKRLTLEVPDDLHNDLTAAATRQYRTIEQQALWLLTCQLRGIRQGPYGPRGLPTDPEAVDALRNALVALHVQAGLPSLRLIARQLGISHSTVHAAVTPRGGRLPSWSVIKLVVTYLDGDAEHFHQLWTETRITPETTESSS